MSYEKGLFAFFDGTSSEYRKVLKRTDTIAGYKVEDIAPNHVKLASGTNEFDLPVGMQMRREEEGDWLLTTRTETPSAGPSRTYRRADKLSNHSRRRRTSNSCHRRGTDDSCN